MNYDSINQSATIRKYYLSTTIISFTDYDYLRPTLDLPESVVSKINGS